MLLPVARIYSETIFDEDVIVSESDKSGATITYIVPEAEFQSSTAAGVDGFFDMNVPRTAQVRSNGQVQIPMKIVAFAVPPGADLNINVINSEYKSSEFRKLAPYFSRPSEALLKEAYLSAEADNPIVPPTSPFITSRDNIRGLNVIKLAIPTADYDPANSELSVLKSITLRVDFIGGDPAIITAYSDPGKAYDRILRKILANYDVGRDWFVSRTALITNTAENMSAFDSSDTWVRIELSAEGIYKIGWLEFNAVGIDPLSIDPANVRMFYGGGKELPLSNFDPRPELQEIPIEILGGGDGQFDNGDYVVFYAESVDGWEYSTDVNRYEHYRNHYTSKNVYWLTYGGNFSGPPRRFTGYNGTPSGPYDLSVQTYTARYVKEDEWLFFRSSPLVDYSDYFDWYWGYGRDFTASPQISDPVQGEEALIVVRHRLGAPTLRVNLGSTIAPTTNQNISTYYTTNLSDGLNRFDLHTNNEIYLDYIEAHYKRWLKLQDENLSFVQPETSGVVRYTLTDVVSPYYLLDITDSGNPIEINGAQLQGTALQFQDSVAVDSHKQYYISSVARLKSPSSVSLYDLDNLRDTTSPENRADEIIITYDGFYDQAVTLANHRASYYGMPTRIVKISDVYNQFSYGLVDAVAIRDFLKYTYENWPAPAPTFALLLGDGHYDFRNNLGTGGPIFIPPFENDHAMSDEHYIYFGNKYYFDSDSSGAPDMIIGRIPANSAADAEDMIGKTIDYDSSPDLGSWRNRVVIAADDNTTPKRNNETFHTTQAETLANQHVPSRFEVAKIYLIEYPMRNLEKPEAREALIGAFNQGSLIIDWIGHGSPGLWADEHIFRRSEDIPRLVNGKRLPLVFTASCSIGFFDDPTEESFGEELIRKRSRGAVEVISATRSVFANPNTQFNNEVFDQLLYQDSVGVGEAMYVAKYLRQLVHLEPNDRYYVLFGDPAQLLQFPKFDVRFTQAPDSLVALSVNNIAGEITDNNGNVINDFNGTVWVTVKDGTINRSIVMRDRNNNPLPPPNNTISFLSPGVTIFTGPADVVNGQFTSEFFVPKDVSYGSQGAKIYAYSENGDIDAVGVVDSILVSGAIPAIADSIGPELSLFADGRPFVPGITLVGSGFSLTAELFDEHGINITGQLGHAIVLKVDDGEEYEADVTGSFSFARGDYQRGTLEVSMPALSPGEHKLSIKAWDNFNNSSLVEKSIEVVATEKLRVSEVMNYPNPVRQGDAQTSIQYCLNADVDKVGIKVFTETGRKIKSIELKSSEFTAMGCHQVVWNLRDGDGDPLANGIYIYQVSADGRDLDGKRSTAKSATKLAVLR